MKKFITGEKLSSRLPYAVLTRLFQIIGWKRIELNKLFQFDGITEHNVESIIRRCSVLTLASYYVYVFSYAFLREE